MKRNGTPQLSEKESHEEVNARAELVAVTGVILAIVFPEHVPLL